ncbi:MAG: M28 family peptidase [Acidobacteriota bacterium]
MRLAALLFLSVFLASSLPTLIDPARLRAHIRFLSSDLLEGRAVGTRGGQLTAEYLASAFAAAGARPAAPDGSYFQTVPLTGVTTLPATTLSLNNQPLSLGRDFVLSSFTQEASFSLSAPLVFVGHGIRAPEFQWDDYAGLDARGKIVVLFTGEPPSTDPAFFAGPALTYYGRWTYKFEQAARQGALGALIVHTDATATYPFTTVLNSFGRESIQLTRTPSTPALRLAGWISAPAASAAGLDLPALLARADARGFTPQPLSLPVSVQFSAQVRSLVSQNVAALIPGSDSTLAQQHVLYSAHWDHLGLAPSGPDRIYNGAVDNASGCAILIELARAFAQVQPRPRRSILLLAVTAEESGLLGSLYYSRNPLLPLSALELNINVDGIPPGGKPGGILALGEDKKNVTPLIAEAARRHSLALKPDPRPEAGLMFRSDHFSFLRAGASAYSFNPVDVPGSFATEYNAKHYHQPSDEYSPNWDMTSLEIYSRFVLTLGLSAASR